MEIRKEFENQSNEIKLIKSYQSNQGMLLLCWICLSKNQTKTPAGLVEVT